MIHDAMEHAGRTSEIAEQSKRVFSESGTKRAGRNAEQSAGDGDAPAADRTGKRANGTEDHANDSADENNALMARALCN